MKTIVNDVSNTYIVSKSKFIAFIFYLENAQMIEKILSDLRRTYNDATHICYGYVFDNISRFNDDHEPNGTAGMPILNVLLKNDLNRVLGVVVRFYGGVKLGAGNLTRTYASSIKETLTLTSLTDLVEQSLIEIKFNYNETNDINNIIGNDKMIDKEFNDMVRMTILTSNPDKYQKYLIKVIEKKKVKDI